MNEERAVPSFCENSLDIHLPMRAPFFALSIHDGLRYVVSEELEFVIILHRLSNYVKIIRDPTLTEVGTA